MGLFAGRQNLSGLLSLRVPAPRLLEGVRGLITTRGEATCVSVRRKEGRERRHGLDKFWRRVGEARGVWYRGDLVGVVWKKKDCMRIAHP